MGWDADRFPEVDQELICSICAGVFDSPVETPCRHVFCHDCLKKWLEDKINRTCPTCRSYVRKRDIRHVVPVLNNILSKQIMYCDNKDKGCEIRTTVENSQSHLSACGFGEVVCQNEDCNLLHLRMDAKKHAEICPKRMVQCDLGCEILMVFDEKESHNCIMALKNHFKSVTSEHEKRITKLQQQVGALYESFKTFVKRSEFSRYPTSGINIQPSSSETERDLQLSTDESQFSTHPNNQTDVGRNALSHPLNRQIWTRTYPRIPIRSVNTGRANADSPRQRSRSPLAPDLHYVPSIATDFLVNDPWSPQQSVDDIESSSSEDLNAGDVLLFM